MRSAVAMIVALGIGAAFVPPSAGAEASPPAGLVIPAEQNQNPNAARLVGAGATGYLWGQAGEGYNWTSYADGSTRAVPVPDKQRVATVAGTDVVTFTGLVSPVQRDMRTGQEWSLPIPSGWRYAGTYGGTVVTTATTEGKPGLRQLSWKNGQVVETLVAGLPDGARSLYVQEHGSADGVFVEATVNSRRVVYRLDGSGLHPTALLDSWVTPGEQRVVQRFGDTDTYRVWDLTDLSKPAHEITLTDVGDEKLLGVVGDEVLYTRPSATGGDTATDHVVLAVPVTGGPERVVLDRAAAIPVVEPDGTMLLGRASGSQDATSSVYALRAGAEGRVTTAKVADVAAIATVVEGMSMAQGRLHTVDRIPFGQARLRRTDVSPSGSPTAGPRVDRGLFNQYAGCDWDWCEEVQSTGDGRLAYQGINGTGLSVLDESASLPARKVNDQPTYQQPHDTMQASGRYTVARIPGPSSEDYSPRLQVIDLDTGKPVYTGPAQNAYMPAFAIDGSTLWVEGASQGVVQALDVRTGENVRSVDVGDCDLTDLRANGTDLYWECATGTSGVYGTVTKKSVLLPAHGDAMLGDGYVGWEKDGVLSVTDVRGTTGTHVVGRPANPAQGEGWTVDRFGGPLAFADTDGRVHVVPSGVPASALSVRDSAAAASVNVASAPWSPRWWLSKPASSWQLTLRNAATGATVRTLAGGEVRGLVKAGWDGKDAGGRFAANGAYRWTLTAKPADGRGVALTASGTVKVSGAAAAPRDFVGNDGYGDLLAFTSAGKADWRAGTGTGAGRVEDKVSGTGWTGGNTVTAAVPFEDISGDRCNDVLVRTKAGELRAYKPGCGAALKPTTPYKKIGTGWNMFDALTSPGDMSGDGRADLLGRTPSGDLYFYQGKGDGLFEPRVKIGYGWQGYLLAGTGDLDGDGKGDLVARDRSGNVWRYPATVNGTLGARTKIGYGWTMYDTMVGSGDLNGDGRADLLARDTSGVLWSYRGDGKGALAARTKVGGSWQMYKNLF
ncbi:MULTISPECIES: FG-GAP-like repeat-containing protein [unclassified Streptomyces]|uniref:FG-GAP-like repeat-containing protein n=1 Tax=unclassified Streptomyces TaxID=2593676 RepID=UPI001F1C3D61|nr:MULTISPECIES: FG-GAP-like repeat-containing protein [unclassified Streptomyces]